MFNVCLLNLFIYFVLGYHIRWLNKVVYYRDVKGGPALPRTSLEPDLVPFSPGNFTLGQDDNCAWEPKSLRHELNVSARR